MIDSDDKQIEILNEEDIVSARQLGRDIAKKYGFKLVESTQIAAAISELARNIIIYAQKGIIAIKMVLQGNDIQGIEIVAQDSGPGIENIELVMRDGYSTSRGLGLGLPGTKRLMDEFVLQSEPGRGTTVIVKKWLNK
jgi:serine/threonine-protein kinase RsbT